MKRDDGRRDPVAEAPLQDAVSDQMDDVMGLVGDEDIEIVELDSNTDVAEPVDVALYDTFAQGEGDAPPADGAT